MGLSAPRMAPPSAANTADVMAAIFHHPFRISILSIEIGWYISGQVQKFSDEGHRCCERRPFPS